MTCSAPHADPCSGVMKLNWPRLVRAMNSEAHGAAKLGHKGHVTLFVLGGHLFFFGRGQFSGTKTTHQMASDGRW